MFFLFGVITKMILKKGGQSVYNNGFGIPYLESKALCLKQPYCTRDNGSI